jgi:hypothetical protein
MESSGEIQKLLEDDTTPSIRKAAKRIAKDKLLSFGQALHVKLKKILANPKQWETQVEIINALGLINYRPAILEIDAICKTNKEFDMVTYASATAYVRLKREKLSDCRAVFELLSQKGYAVTCGALDALGYDRMMPESHNIVKLMDSCIHLRSPDPKSLSDPRYGLAAACAGWDKKIVTDFLNSCIQTGDAPLKYVAENALKGKYVKLR